MLDLVRKKGLIKLQSWKWGLDGSVLWLGSETLDFETRGRGFDSRSRRYPVITALMGDCLSAA